MNAHRRQASFLHHGSNKPSEVYGGLKMHPHLRQRSPEGLPNLIQTAPPTPWRSLPQLFSLTARGRKSDRVWASLRPHGNHFTQRSHPVDRRALGCRGNGGAEKSGPHPDPRRSLSGAGRRSLAISPGPATRWLVYLSADLFVTPEPLLPSPSHPQYLPSADKGLDCAFTAASSPPGTEHRLHKSRPHPCDT